MEKEEFYGTLRAKVREIVDKHNIADDRISVISARPLTPYEAIGRPERRDFPLLKGKEVMIEAVFRGSIGQAFTDSPSDFKGTVSDLLELPLSNNSERAIFIASLNAIMRHFGYITNTVHCKDGEPEICAERLLKYIKERFHNPKIAFIGFQPAMISKLSQSFQIEVVDLDKDNIGKEKFGLKIFGPEKTPEVVLWGDVVIATSSTAANRTMVDFIGKKPVIFYGVTGASVCAFLGLTRFCPCSH
jgi:uncharacterized protein (DUF4213/DUF364 family)